MASTAAVQAPTSTRFTTSGNKGSAGYGEAGGATPPEQVGPVFSVCGEGAPAPASVPHAGADATPLGTSLDAPETSPASALSYGARLRLAVDTWAQVDAETASNDPADVGTVQPPSRFSQGHPLEVQSTSQRIIHRPYDGQRWPIVNALWNAEDEKLAKRARRLGLCCSTPTLRIRGESSVYACLQRCRDRLCPLCADKRGKVCAAKAIALTKLMNAPRFVTLTTAARDVPLFLALRHLISSFARLRNREEWRSWVKGGIYALEVTRNPRTGQWHPHLHLIVDGEFIPQAKLKRLWHAITRDSFIVDVRAVPDRAKAATYIARYVAKPQDVHKWPPEAIREYAETLHGARMIQPFGSCVGVSLDADDEPGEELPSRHVVHGFVLERAEKAGNIQAGYARDVFARMGLQMAAAVGVDRKPESRNYPTPTAAEVSRALAVALLLNRSFPDLSPALDFSTADSGETARSLPPPVAGCQCAQEGGRCCCDPPEPTYDLLTLFADGAHDDTSFREPVIDRRDDETPQ